MLSHFGLVEKHSFLDFSNAFLGMIFYAGIFINNLLPIPNLPLLVLLASVGSLCFSVFLLYVLHYILKDFCIVCFGMHIANMIIFFASVARFYYLEGPGSKPRRKVVSEEDKDK